MTHPRRPARTAPEASTGPDPPPCPLRRQSRLRQRLAPLQATGRRSRLRRGDPKGGQMASGGRRKTRAKSRQGGRSGSGSGCSGSGSDECHQKNPAKSMTGTQIMKRMKKIALSCNQSCGGHTLEKITCPKIDISTLILNHLANLLACSILTCFSSVLINNTSFQAQRYK